MLKSEVVLIDLAVPTDDSGTPLARPDIGEDNVVVAVTVMSNGTEQLTVCRNLPEMVNEYAFASTLAFGAKGISWYFADKKECERAHGSMMVG